MKKLFIITSVLLAILAISLFGASCTAQGENTTTITATGGATTIILGSDPPEIPHAYLVEVAGVPYLAGNEPICFVCHPVPDQHEGWWLDETLCDECHVVSDNPILVQ